MYGKKFVYAFATILFAATDVAADDSRYSPDTNAWQTYMSAGKDACAKGQYELAGKNFSLAVNEAERFDSKSLQLADSLTRLADAHYALFTYSDVEPLYQRALAIREKILGPGHLVVADTLSGLGRLRECQAIGIAAGTTPTDWSALPLQKRLIRFAEAERFFDRALKIREQVSNSTLEVAKSLIDLGQLRTTEGDWLPDEPLILEANRISQSKKQRYEQAEAFYSKALAIREKLLDAGDIDLVDCLEQLAAAYIKGSDFDQANTVISRVMAILKKQNGPGQPDRTVQLQIATTGLNNLGVFYLSKKEDQAALRMFDEATRLNPNYILARKNRSVLRRQLGDTTGADADADTVKRLKSP